MRRLLPLPAVLLGAGGGADAAADPGSVATSSVPCPAATAPEAARGDAGATLRSPGSQPIVGLAARGRSRSVGETDGRAFRIDVR